MKVAVGADHAGVEFKNRIVEVLCGLGHEVEDMGPDDDTSVDYPDFAARVAGPVGQGLFERGVLVCSTGIGMSMAANRVKKVRAAVCTNEHAAEMSRRHNDANILCLGARILSWDDVRRIVEKWFDTPFEGGRHERRVAKIDNV